MIALTNVTVFACMGTKSDSCTTNDHYMMNGYKKNKTLHLKQVIGLDICFVRHLKEVC